MPPRWQNAVQAICHAPLHPIGAQVTGHIPMSVRRGPPDRPHSHGGQTRPRKAATPHGSRTGSRGQATPPRQPDGALGPGHTPTAARRRAGNRPHDLGRQTMPRGPAMPRGDHPWPNGLVTTHGDHPRPGEPASTPRRPPGDRPHPTSTRQEPGGWPHTHRDQTGTRRLATHPRRPDGTKGTGHVSKVARWGAEDRPRPHGGYSGCR